MVVTGVKGITISNYDKFDIFLDPDTLTEPATPTLTAQADLGQSEFDTFAMREFYLHEIQFTNLTIGDSWGAVVPEPSMLLLLASGALVMFFWGFLRRVRNGGSRAGR